MKKQLKFLVVEDDPHISDLIKLYINKWGHDVIARYDGESGLAAYYDEQPDFIVLDIMLPDLDGWEVCREVRHDQKQIPILMLTGKGESYDRIKGLELGADDYVVKPFDPNELIARIKAILRRSHQYDQQYEVLEFTNLSIDLNEYIVKVEGEPITLPPKELELLYYLASHQNQVFTRQQLLDHIWGFDFDGDPRTVDVHIKRLREKISTNNEATWALKTVRGVGYKFEVHS
ncbi:response regulator transcription factor [Alkalibacillus silvisoli]|uniref:Response regulator transcription factor n=1 Tax=Alkalibacillus silvisoli TaxID=392823 RepID=A0ABN1A1U3_9BACI